MEKKSVKQQRVESYFIDAAKKIIKDEGVHSVSVRKIAELSGYSYGSIYNYYADLDELLFNVKNSMIYDMVGIMQEYDSDRKPSLQDLKEGNRRFITYFIENPNVYEFFYTFPIKKQGNTPMDDVSFDENRTKAYMGFVEDGIITMEELPTVIMTVICSIFGLLTLYFSSNGMTKEQVYESIDNITENLLKGDKK
ncbi:MAG: TetR/AcrR family transcriptional regulator [Eubacteriales bacterium]